MLRVRVVSEDRVGDRVRYTAHVVRSYKGELEADAEIQFETRYSSAACGLGPELRGDYLVTARRNDSQALFASACGFTVPFSSLEDAEVHFLESRANAPR